MLNFEKDFKWIIECYENMQWMNAIIWKNFMYKNYTIFILDAHAFCSNANTKLLKPWSFPCALVLPLMPMLPHTIKIELKTIAIIVKSIFYFFMSFQTILNFSKKQTYSLIFIFKYLLSISKSLVWIKNYYYYY